MGTFHVGCVIINHVDRSKSIRLPKLPVDTGSEYTWVPASKLEKIGVQREKKDIHFVMANGEEVTRNMGFAIIRIDKYFTIDEVVFAQKGDLLLLGARTLEGLNRDCSEFTGNLVKTGPL
jgi:predicted aspartyl protease